MAWTEEARWFEARLAHNRKPAHYRCPLCGRQLPSMSEHMLLFPEGDHSRRRHAHSACVLAARKQGKLLTRDEWRRAQGRGAEERRFSARKILWALRPKLKRSRPSDS